jgi:hypothetical protein
MTMSIPQIGAAPDASGRRGIALPNWLREPLLHFVLLGGALFAIDHAVVGRGDEPHTIVVDAVVDRQAIEVFRTARGRAPNEEELYALRRVWLDNEVLYREGLAMRLDKGDDSIRDRVVFKSLSIIDANTKLPSYDDKVLRAWFDSHRVKYDEPQRFDFQEAVLAGDNAEPAVRAFVAALNAGTPGDDVKAGLRVFKGRPYANLVQGYGEEFAKAMAEQTIGEWRALPTRDGWRAMRLEAVAPAKPAVYEALRNIVLQDWTDATLADQRGAAVRALAKKYTIQYATEKR